MPFDGAPCIGKGQAPPTVLLLVNKDTTILNFRRSLPVSLREAGYRVVIALPRGERWAELAETGAELWETPMKKDAVSPVHDLRLLCMYRRIIRALTPRVILTYTVKPTVWGGMAAGRVPLIATITGRGRALAGGPAVRSVTLWLHRRALRHAAAVCFQNEADRAYFARHRIAVGHHVSVPGSGVDLERFTPIPYPSAEAGTAFAFISRLLPEKGLELYVELAQRIHRIHPEVVFHVAGFGDAATEARMRALSEAGVIVYHGMLRDIRPLLGLVHAVIHPTTYPEGMANILLEASACARPVITTNRPGCREAVREGITGFLIPEHNPIAAVSAVERFLALPQESRAAMGRAARVLMEQGFDRRAVVARYMSLIHTCTSAAEAPKPTAIVT